MYTLKQIQAQNNQSGFKLLTSCLKLLTAFLIITQTSFAQTVNNCHTTPTAGFISGNVDYGSSINWATPNNSLASDDAYARTSIKSPQITKYLRDRDFHFSVPSYAVITGIIVYIEKKQDAGANIQDNSIRIELNGTPVGNDYAVQGAVWPTSDAIFTYGGFGDMWGLSLTPSDVNNATFGVLTSAYIPAGGDSSTTYYAYIDNVAIDVCFTVPIDSTCGLYALPVSVSRFDARVMEDRQVRLNWTTNSETNNDYFIVERSTDGEHFEPVRKVDGAGNSSTLLDYEATDEIYSDGIYFYRLASVDFDGNFNPESRTITVRINAADNALHIFPNPSGRQGFNFSIPVDAGEEIIILVFNERGEKQFEQKISSRFKSTLNSTIVFPQILSAGIYRVQCISSSSYYCRNLMLHDQIR